MVTNASTADHATPSIPVPTLQVLDNQTPFRVLQFDKMGPARRFFDVVVVKATFRLEAGRMPPAETISPIHLCDEARDPRDPERTSLRYAGDVLLGKPTTDLFFSGRVHAPHGEAQTRWDLGVVVRSHDAVALRHGLTVTGPREFRHSRLGGWVLSDPAPTDTVPIQYELAYGGPRDGSFDEPACRRRPAFRANPSGCGEVGAAPDKRLAWPAPQWQLPTEKLTTMNRPIAPAGLGPLSRHWSSRAALAGTYDDGWRARARAGAIDYPRDFDPRFFQCAPRELQAPRHLEGNEWIGLQHAARGGNASLASQLPCEAVIAHIETRTASAVVKLPLDTIHIDLDEDKVDLVWRLTLDRALGVERCALGAVRLPR